MKKIVLVLILVTLIVFYQWDTIKNWNAEEALYIEQNEGAIAKINSSKAYPIASLTKVMTSYIVFDYIERGRLTWDTSFTIEQPLFKDASGLAMIGLQVGQSYTVRELYESMMITSANDSAMALALLLNGSEQQFVENMNHYANQMDLKKTNFVNATGLDQAGAVNESSAEDLARLVQLHLRYYPEVIETTKKTHYVTRSGKKYWSTNHLLPGMPEARTGVDGFKTGYTHRANDTYIVTGIHNGERYIAVMLNVPRKEKQTEKFSKMNEYMSEYLK